MTHDHSEPSVHSTGFIVLDLLLADGRLTPVVGGTAANVAINLALLGWRSSVTAFLGDDAAGQTIRDQFNAYGVDTNGVVLDPQVETPVLIHEVSPEGHRFRFTCPSCRRKFAKFRPLPPSRAKTAPEADVHFFDRASSYALGLSGDRRSESAIVFEPGTMGRPDATGALASAAHLIRTSNDLELPTINSERAEQTQIVGMGEFGVRMRPNGEAKWTRLPSHMVGNPVDAGGAGDWLTAGTLVELDPAAVRDGSVSEDDLASAVSNGLQWAAACCADHGTRGFVGGVQWATLAKAAGLKEDPSLPDLVSLEVPAHADCRFWHHVTQD